MRPRGAPRRAPASRVGAAGRARPLCERARARAAARTRAQTVRPLVDPRLGRPEMMTRTSRRPGGTWASFSRRVTPLAGCRSAAHVRKAVMGAGAVIRA